MNRIQAETFAAAVLGWLAEDHARIGAFLAMTGMTSAELRRASGESDFSLAVVDFLMTDEALLIECCRSLEVPATTPAAAREALPGGAQVHWT